MANYNIVADFGDFKPFTFAEKMAPLSLIKEDYDKQLEKLEKYSEEYGNMTLPENSIYKPVLDLYNQDLKNYSDDFAYGMTPLNKSALNKMFVRGKAELAPIKKAIESYNKYVDRRNELGADAIYDRNYTVDDFYNGIKPDIKYQSEKGITSSSALYFAGLNELLNDSNPEFKNIQLAGYKLQHTKGLDPGEALIAAASLYGDTQTGNIILLHMNKFAKDLGIENYDAEGQKRIWRAIGNGLVSSYKNTDKIVQDPSYITPYQNKLLEIQEGKTNTKGHQTITDAMVVAANLPDNILNKLYELFTYTKSDGSTEIRNRLRYIYGNPDNVYTWMYQGADGLLYRVLPRSEKDIEDPQLTGNVFSGTSEK